MPRFASLFLFFLASALAVGPAVAQTTPGPAQTFATQQRGGGQDFAYTYLTPEGQPRSLSFRLNLADIQRGSAEFQPWNDDAARTAAVNKVQATATALATPNLKATVQGLPNGMTLRLVGRNLTPQSPQVQLLEKTLNTTYTMAIKTYASQNLYRATSEGDHQTTIQPDHPAIAVRYTAAMGPVAEAIQQQIPGAADSPRNFINAALNWLQTIPYDTLKNRATSNGAGFQTPYGLMLGNRGDCDTKATALASLIRAAYPTIPLAIIYVPEHAFLGIGLPQEDRDYALRTEYGTYILADATGPARTPLGYIDERTRTKIRANETELLPIR
jgi:transglutaminase-like putative cysteine protease